MTGGLNADDVSEWASALEMRDDVQFGQEDPHVFHIIFKLSTPELEGPLTSQRAENLIKALTTDQPTENDFNKAYE